MSNNDSNEHDHLSRRSFMRLLMWGSLALALVQSAIAGIYMAWPRKSAGFGGKIVAGKVADFPLGAVTKVAAGRFYIAHLPEGLIALHWRCTHLSCTVPWAPGENLFVCPCHGSQFDMSGRNLSGPAPRPLDYMELEIRDGMVIVDTGAIRQRQTHLAEHATPV